MSGKYTVEIDVEGTVLNVSYNGKPLEKTYGGAIQRETITNIGSIFINKKLDPWKICVPDGHGGIR